MKTGSPWFPPCAWKPLFKRRCPQVWVVRQWRLWRHLSFSVCNPLNAPTLTMLNWVVVMDGLTMQHRRTVQECTLVPLSTFLFFFVWLYFLSSPTLLCTITLLDQDGVFPPPVPISYLQEHHGARFAFFFFVVEDFFPLLSLLVHVAQLWCQGWASD